MIDHTEVAAPPPTQPTVALLGSFRQFFTEVTQIARVLHAGGVTVTSPKELVVNEEGIDFVRFPSDDVTHDDATIQTIAMHRIAGADATYVVAPQGYVGRTTCYEIGRLIHLDVPLYFSEPPKDLPIHVPADAVISPSEMVDLAGSRDVRRWSSWRGHANYDLELALLRGQPDRTL